VASNAEIAEQFEEIAARVYLAGEPWFKIRAYRRAAATFRELAEDVVQLANEGRLQELPGVGPEITKKTEAYLATRHIPLLDRLRAQQPEITDTTQTTLELGTPRTGTSQPASPRPQPSPSTPRPRAAAGRKAGSRTSPARRG
jgi:DNA polymerase/3'-5' exonuclease PolX